MKSIAYTSAFFLILGVSSASAQSAPPPAPYVQDAPPSGVQPLPPVDVIEQPALADEEGPRANNAVYIEGLGNGAAYSINYERLIVDELAFRIGFSYIQFDAPEDSVSDTTTLVMAPLMLSYYGIGNDRHHLELGLGAVLGYASTETSSPAAASTGSGVGVIGTATVGYRFQPREGGFVFRAGFTPLFAADDALGFQPWFGVSLGGAF
jgi:hypothetical protein